MSGGRSDVAEDDLDGVRGEMDGRETDGGGTDRDGIDAELGLLAARAGEPLRVAVKYGLRGGKRARGMVLMAAGEGFGLAGGAAVRAAACMELLHAATLVQDDIFDRGHTRRGRPAVYRVFGPQLATLVSDWMLAEAVRAAFGLHADLGEALSTCAQRMMAGEAREAAPCRARSLAGMRGHALAVACGKTGELFGLAVSAPLLLAGDARGAERVRRCGCELGVAFQYLDDTLDLYGDRAGAGKEVARDVAARLCTLPMLDALPLLPPALAQALLAGAAPDALRALQAQTVQEHVLACARVRWQVAVAALTRELPQAGRLPALLGGLAAFMLPVLPVLRESVGKGARSAA